MVASAVRRALTCCRTEMLTVLLGSRPGITGKLVISLVSWAYPGLQKSVTAALPGHNAAC